MNDLKVKDTMKRYGASTEECSRLNGALTCLRKATRMGKERLLGTRLTWIQGNLSHLKGNGPQPRSVSVSTIPSSDNLPTSQGPPTFGDSLLESFAFPTHCGRRNLRTPHSTAVTPPTTPQLKRGKPPRTPPPPSRKVFQLLPNFPTLTRSKSHELPGADWNQAKNVELRLFLLKGSPQAVRRDIGLSVTHRLKCHNKCTKEAPPCRISFLPKSVPSDINNPVDRPSEPQFGTLPKAQAKKDHPTAINHLDSSSNPSSTTSSTPSSPAPFQSSNPPSATPPPNPSPMGQRDSRFNFPGKLFSEEQKTQHTDDQEQNKMEAEDDEDEIDDLPTRRSRWRGMISRKASQTSVYLQEWDIPFEQIELGDPIGQGRWGKVYRGRWHGEVAIRLLEIDGNNQDHLKLFKKEVMNYRQTRHENVVLFMGACMNPPHLAIITRDPKTPLDINKTRQIAQEIIKGMGYLHAKGIVHKDLKSKNIFYENGKVVITDFGLFGISGVVQEGRRENELKLPHDWLCYLAPEIVREMAPGKDEDKLPFSKAADVYAFGEWPFQSQPAEALIWQIGSGEGMKHVLQASSLGKEVGEILSACWAFDVAERPSFTLLMEMLEKLPKLNRRLSHPGHFWKSAEYVFSLLVSPISKNC
ncbi:Kinase suppressor of Ras 2, partial [Ophiophagus hannah]